MAEYAETLPLQPLDELALYLVPPGEGVFAVSAGKAQREAATAQYLGHDHPRGRPWREAIERALVADVALLAIPSDNGAGIVRGAARGPEAIRAAFGQAPVAELGDVFTIPHLLDDEMLNLQQRTQSQAALYPQIAPTLRQNLPVAPLSIAARVAELIRQSAPQLRLLSLGGDHSVSWPLVRDLLLDRRARGHLANVGILHFDAHTDLSPQRLGVDYCFATWAYHANRLLGDGVANGPNQRMLQVGIRTSARSQEHWENTLGVRQIWAKEARARKPRELAEAVVEHFILRGVTELYVTNDIDATDPYWAAACGTPEADGLTPESVLAILEALKKAPFCVVGADVVEVAPGLSLDHAASARTVETAKAYAYASIDLLRA